MSTRDAYIAKLKAQLDEWNAEVKKWEAKAKGAQADVRIEYEKQLAVFHQQRDQAMRQMQQVQKAAGDAWQDLMRGTDDAWAKADEAFAKARSHFHK